MADRPRRTVRPTVRYGFEEKFVVTRAEKPPSIKPPPQAKLPTPESESRLDAESHESDLRLDPIAYDARGCALFSKHAYKTRKISKVREMLALERGFCLVMVRFEGQPKDLPPYRLSLETFRKFESHEEPVLKYTRRLSESGMRIKLRSNSMGGFLKEVTEKNEKN